MIVYIPVYDHGERVEAIETERLRPMIGSADDPGARICNYKPGVGFYGPIYNNKFFLEESEVLKYWHGDHSRRWTLATIRELENMIEREDKTA